MHQTTVPTVPVTADQMVELTRAVWSSFLSLDLDQVDAAATSLEGPRVTGVVFVAGAWGGGVVLECERAHACVAAEAMFEAEPDSLSVAELADAFGELTNMVGGSIKSLLPAPSALSIPSVTQGDSYVVRIPGAHRVERVALACPRGQLQVSLWQL